MSRFYASIQGNRGATTRGGSAASGIYGHIRGWYIGAEVEMNAQEGPDLDEVTVQLTGGSAGHRAYTVFTAKELPQGGVEITVYTPDGPVSWTL